MEGKCFLQSEHIYFFCAFHIYEVLYISHMSFCFQLPR